MSYNSIIERVFLARYRPGDTLVEFIREDLVDAATALGVPFPATSGMSSTPFVTVALYPRPSWRRHPKREWSIRGAGPAAYAFRLVAVNRVVPNPALTTIKIPDATPEIVSAHAMSDEQALRQQPNYKRNLGQDSQSTNKISVCVIHVTR